MPAHAQLPTAVLPHARRQLLQGAAASNGGGNNAGGSGTYPDPSLTDHYVEVIDGQFVLGCRQFPVSGWNE